MRFLDELKRRRDMYRNAPNLERKLHEAEAIIAEQQHLIDLLIGTWEERNGLYVPPGL